MRFRFPFLLSIFTLGFFVVPHFAHAAIPFFGPIIPAANATCPAGWDMLIVVMNNIISFSITLAIVFVAPIMIAWAGFLLVTNEGNSSKLAQAKGIITNTIVGIVIALAGWMIINALLVALTGTGNGVAKWTALITGDGSQMCLPQDGTSSGGSGGGGGIGPPPPTGDLLPTPPGFSQTPCDPAYLRSINSTISISQANILSCIAAPESSCQAAPSPPNFNWGNGSSAAGAFQVLLSTHAASYENTYCYAAAGVSGPLNCNQGFTGGNPRTDPEGAAIANRCLQAANNPACSLAAALTLPGANNGTYSDWLSDPAHSRQALCVQTGGQQGGAH